MITFKTENGRFTYRVAGIAIQDGRVLIHKDPDDDFWVLPGGRAEMMERAHETLRREMFEETGFEVSVGSSAVGRRCMTRAILGCGPSFSWTALLASRRRSNAWSM